MAKIQTPYHYNIKIEFVNHIDFLIGEVFYLLHSCYKHDPARQRCNIIFPTYIFTRYFQVSWFGSTHIRHKNGNHLRKDIILRKLDLKLKSYIFINNLGNFYTSPNIVYLIKGTM